MPAHVDWPTIARAEPLLAALDRLVDSALAAVVLADVPQPGYWCANRWFGENVKPFIVRLVGWDRAFQEQASDLDQFGEVTTLAAVIGIELPEPAGNRYEEMLRTRDAYDVVYRRFYAKLPNCVRCSCIDPVEVGLDRRRFP